MQFKGKDQNELEDDMIVDCVMQYNDSYNDQIYSFTNTHSNPDGGCPPFSVFALLSRAINQYAKRRTTF